MKHIQVAKQRLNKEYTCIKREDLSAEPFLATINSAQTWAIVKNITNRKCAPTGKLKKFLQKSVRVNGLRMSRIFLDQLTTVLLDIGSVLPWVEIAITDFVLEEVVVAKNKSGKVKYLKEVTSSKKF